MAKAFVLNNVEVIPDELTVRRDGESVTLEPRAMSLLMALAEEPGKVFSRNELFDAVWGPVEVSDQALTNAIWELRQALGDTPRNSRFVKTIPRRGYQLLVQPGSAQAAVSVPESTSVRAPAVWALAAFLLIGGVVVWWLMQRTLHSPELTAQAGIGAWQFNTGGEIHTDPLVIGDDLVFGSHDGFVYRVSMLGEERWRADVGERVFQNLATDGERLYVVADNDYCYAFDLETGRELWRRRIESNSPPAVSEQGVLIAGYDHALWRLNPENGEAESFMPGIGVVLLAPVIVGPTAILIEEGGRTSAVDLTERRLRWRIQLEGDVFASPSVQGDTLLVGTDAGFVYALDINSGEERWRTRVAERNAGGTTVDNKGKTVIVGTHPGELVALGFADGSELWRVSGESFFSPPVSAHGVVFAGNGDGRLYAVSVADGRQLWQADYGAWLLTRPAVVGGMVVAGDAKGRLNAVPLSGQQVSGQQVSGQPVVTRAPEARVELAPDPLWSLDLGAPAVIAPTYHQGVIYVAAESSLVALDMNAHEILWRYPTLGSIHSQPAIGGERVWFTSRASELIGIPLTGDGEVIEVQLTEASISGPLWLGDGVVFGDQGGSLHRYSSNGERRWSVQLAPTYQSVNADPLLVDGQIVVGACDGSVYALAPDDGTVLWRLPLGDCVVANTVAGEGLLFTGAADGTFVGFNSSGEEQWRFQADGEIWYQPVVAEGLVVFGSRDYHVYALDALTGEEVWRFRTDNRALSDVVYRDGRFYVGSYDGCLYALAADSGNPQWRFCAGRELINPMIAEDQVLIGGDDGRLYALGL